MLVELKLFSFCQIFRKLLLEIIRNVLFPLNQQPRKKINRRIKVNPLAQLFQYKVTFEENFGQLIKPIEIIDFSLNTEQIRILN